VDINNLRFKSKTFSHYFFPAGEVVACAGLSDLSGE